MSPKQKQPLFVFLHGYGTTKLDILPLMRSFQDKGYDCNAINLSDDNDSIARYKYSEWVKKLDHVVKEKSKKHNLYLVGFSFGGIIALDYAAENQNISGILSISTLFDHSNRKLLDFLTPILDLLHIKKIRRGKLNTTARTTRQIIRGTKYIDLQSIKPLFEKASEVTKKVHKVTCPVLFLHSTEDHVASYDALVRSVLSGGDNFRIVTGRELNHFIQFDIPSVHIRNIALLYFSLINKNLTTNNEEALGSKYSELKQQERHWAETIFKLIVGFFSIFGFLFLTTFTNVLDDTIEAPYYVISYLLVILIYLLLIGVYFFYMNRVSSFIKHHLDPMMPGISLVSFRNQISGKLSSEITRNASIVTMGFPFLIATFLMFFFPINYLDCLIPICEDHIIMYILYGFAVMLYLFNTKLVLDILKYTKRELYRIAAPSSTTSTFEKYYFQLVSSINPGGVEN